MKALFVNFSNGNSLENCVFCLPKTVSGLYKLDTIYDANKVFSVTKSCLYSFDELLNLKGFYISNKRTHTGSKYKTSKGFIKRLKSELHVETKNELF